MDISHYSSLSEWIIEWYWKHGYKRSGKYGLPTGEWLDKTYQLETELAALHEASIQHRPSIAIWGPSQTGKSTLVSKYVDTNVVFEGDVSVDGSNSALHFPGGSPAFFLAPQEDEVAGKFIQDDTIVLNPFNSGLDASACLSRFTLADLDGNGQGYSIPDPMFPMEIRLVRPMELWQSIARGYDSQCLGPPPSRKSLENAGGRSAPRYPTLWTKEKFDAALDKSKNVPVRADATPSKEAYELLHGFCELIEDFIFAELTRFRQLDLDSANWQSLRREILSDNTESKNALLYEIDRAKEFVYTILWDGYQILTDYYESMLDCYRSLHAQWGDKPIRCSIEVAALFLDMETYTVFLKQLPARPRVKDKRIHNLVPRIAWEERDDYIALGTSSSLPHKLISNPEMFGIIQGLVWEIVAPLNPQNLEDTQFKSFLANSDLLDFPGVERGGQSSEASKVDLDTMVDLRRTGRPPAEDEEASEPYQFFIKILKRGKTSSIVSTYAKRLTIDGFCIFQDLDRDKPNGGELITGINTWWKHNAPTYYANQSGRSPLPLNFVLLWWATLFNEGHTMQNLSKKYSVLGSIADPDVARTFALNYYSITRGRIQDDKLAGVPEAVELLKSESSWQRQFKDPLSQKSFDAMISDKDTGGTEFFFKSLSNQVLELAQEDASNRKSLVTRKAKNATSEFHELLARNELIPDPKPKDHRRDHLKRFREGLEKAIDGRNEKDLHAINYALRCFLDVDYADLLPVPTDQLDINLDHVRAQCNQWIVAQMARYSEPGDDDSAPDWTKIGIDNRDEFYETLNSIVQSIEPELEQIAIWLRKLRQFSQAVGNLRDDLRRHLAIKIGNCVTFGPAGPRVRLDVEEDDEDEDDIKAIKSEARGKQCKYYRYFIEPFAGTTGHLSDLIDRSVIPITRPDQPGDKELLESKAIRAIKAQHAG